MKLTTTTTRNTTPYEIADALADASPDEFGKVFLRLSERLLDDEARMMAFARALAPDHGGNRKKVLRDLLARVSFLEGQRKWVPIEEDGEEQ